MVSVDSDTRFTQPTGLGGIAQEGEDSTRKRFCLISKSERSDLKFFLLVLKKKVAVIFKFKRVFPHIFLFKHPKGTI